MPDTTPDTDSDTYSDTGPSPWLVAARRSHDRFTALTGPLSDEAVSGPSYDDEWTIAAVASHLGSQAEIFELFLRAGLAGEAPPGGEVFGPIWDRWNALSAPQQVAASAAANESFVARIEQLPPATVEAFSLSLFGTDLDLDGMLAMRLSEHALHTWDVAVALDPTATVADDAVALLVDRLPQAAGRSSVAQESVGDVPVAVSGPERRWLLRTSPTVSLTPTDEQADDALALSAEAFVRLVHGRLDATADEDPRLAGLRTVFPGY